MSVSARTGQASVLMTDDDNRCVSVTQFKGKRNNARWAGVRPDRIIDLKAKSGQTNNSEGVNDESIHLKEKNIL